MLFDDFYDDLFSWDKPSYSFSRNVHDMSPYKLVNKDDRVLLVHNIVGINPDDIKVEEQEENGRHFLVISGVTHSDVLNYDYKVNSKFEFKPDAFDHVSYKAANGLLEISLFKKTPDKSKKLLITKE